MHVHILNQSSCRIPRKFLLQGSSVFFKLLKKRLSKHWPEVDEVSFVFLDAKLAKSLNYKYRKKNYPTDVLSFTGQGTFLGELVLCPQVLVSQAKEQGHSFRNETLYMVIHGVLHLLGFEHETNSEDAEKMFSLQEELYRMTLKNMGSH